MAEYRLAPAAERDLELIWAYTAQQWSVEQAHRYTDSLIDAFAGLARSPTTAPLCDHIRRGYRCHRVERHMIYSRMAGYGMAIIRVLHDRIDAPRYL